MMTRERSEPELVPGTSYGVRSVNDEPAPWFELSEYEARIARVQAELRSRGLDALLAFEPESVTYLTGFHSMQYAMFQFVIVPADAPPTFVVRNVLRFRVERMCVVERRHWWTDGERPADIAVRAIREGLRPGARIGVELNAWTLNAGLFSEIETAMADLTFVEASGLVESFRLIKSPAELGFIRRACKAAEGAMQTAMDFISDGRSERELAAEVARSLVLHGSDSSRIDTIASGPSAFHLGGSWGDRVMRTGDLVFVEVDADVHRYHGRFIRPVRIGNASDEELRLAEALLAVQDSAIAAVAPGVSCRVPDGIYRRGIAEAAGIDGYPNKTFYSVGFMIGPTGFEHLEATPSADWKFAPGMTFHTYMAVQGLSFSEMVAVTDSGVELMTGYPRRLTVKEPQALSA
jgi:Xaa-Pro dipeptidase